MGDREIELVIEELVRREDVVSVVVRHVLRDGREQVVQYAAVSGGGIAGFPILEKDKHAVEGG